MPADPAQERPARRLAAALSRRRHTLALTLLIVMAAAAHGVWMAADTTPFPSTDAYTYLGHLLRFVDGFHHRGSTLSLVALSHAGRPPLYQLVSVPCVLLFGRSEEAALSVNLAFLALLMVAAHGIGSTLRDRSCGLLAALLAGAYPPVVHLVRSYRPSLAVVACVALCAWALARFVRRPTATAGAAVAASFAAGLLIHPMFLWAMAGGVAAAAPWAAVRLLRSRRAAGEKRPVGLHRLDKRERLALAGAGVALATALLWYLFPGRPLLAILQALRSEDVAELRGYEVLAVGFPTVEPSFLWYAETAPFALSWPLALLAAAGWSWALVSALRGRALDAVLAVALAAAYTLFAVQSTLSWIYAAAALPLAAVLSAAVLRDLRPRSLRVTAAALTAITSIYAFAHVSWGAPPVPGSLAARLGDRARSRLQCRRVRGFCAAPPRAVHRPEREVLDAIFADPECRRKEPCTLLVAGMGGTNYAQLAYARRRDFPLLSLAVVANGESAWGQLYPFASLLRADYLLSLDLGSGPRPAAMTALRYGLATARFLAWPPPRFVAAHRRVGTFTSSAGGRLALYRRTARLTRGEAAATVAALEITDDQKGLGAELLAEMERGERPPAPRGDDD